MWLLALKILVCWLIGSTLLGVFIGKLIHVGSNDGSEG